MARDLQIKITTGTGDVSFALDGGWSWRQAPVYKEAANPPELEEIREEWTITGIVRSSTGTAEQGWDDFNAARDKLLGRGTSKATKVEIIRDPEGTPVTELTLGPPTYERFIVEEVTGGEWSDAPAASFRVVFPLTIRISAVRLAVDPATGLPGDANGITSWEQEVSVAYAAGLKSMSWSTSIETQEGVDALAKAKALAYIPASAVGSSYSYVSGNGDEAIEYDILDADEVTGRTPTRVRALSAIQEHGVTIGGTGPGTAPDRVLLEDITNTTADEVLRQRVAKAEGPGRESWVRSHKPTWAQDEEIRDDRSGRIYQVTWTGREASTRDVEDFWILRGELTGGNQVISFEPVSGGLPPVQFVGPLHPYRLSVSIMVEKRGAEGKASELVFPPVLRAPWILSRQESSEGEPYLSERGATAEADKWSRDARLVYYCTRTPKGSPLASLRERKKEAVESYFL